MNRHRLVGAALFVAGLTLVGWSFAVVPDPDPSRNPALLGDVYLTLVVPAGGVLLGLGGLLGYTGRRLDPRETLLVPFVVAAVAVGVPALVGGRALSPWVPLATMAAAVVPLGAAAAEENREAVVAALGVYALGIVVSLVAGFGVNAFTAVAPLVVGIPGGVAGAVAVRK